MAPTKPNLTSKERNIIAQYLWQNSKEGQLFRGIVKKAATKFVVNRRTIQSIWKGATAQVSMGLPINLANKKVGIARPTRLEYDDEKLKSILLQERGTIRGVGKGLGVSTTTAWRWIKSGLIRPHSNAIKPQLAADCVLSRLKFSLNAIELDRTIDQWIFKSMKHIVHIDEKWFYLTKTTDKYYLTQDEPDPHRTCKSKKFITKVMFMCAVTRPIYNEDGTLLFDGKIGIFPFTHRVAAKRNSKRRVAGTMETKSIESITKEVIKACMINEVVPAIKRKWPLMESTYILIQQDNARPHIDDSDPAFREAACSDGFNIHLVCQPTNSPDLNVNDLGWFRALQALQTKRASLNIDQLVAAVEDSFDKLSHKKLNNVFLSLQNCMIEILKVKGNNNYKLPHMSKERLNRLGSLPESLTVEEELVKESVDYLIAAGEATEIGSIIEEFNVTTLHM